MSNENDPNLEDKDASRRENRFMFLSVVVILVLLIGGMGINMLIHRDANGHAVETTSPSK